MFRSSRCLQTLDVLDGIFDLAVLVPSLYFSLYFPLFLMSPSKFLIKFSSHYLSFPNYTNIQMSEELTNQTESLTLESKTVFDTKEEFNAKHPLNNRWTLWYTKPQTNKSENWHDLLKPVITFSSVEEFWGIYNSIPVANQLPLKSDYHLFKEGIRPEWEDEQNAKGGKWQYSFNNKREAAGVINDLWLRGLLAVIGETIEDNEDEVNGIVLNIRKQAFRVGIWTKDCEDDKLRTVGERLKKVLQLGDEHKVEFISHDASNKKGSEAQIVL